MSDHPSSAEESEQDGKARRAVPVIEVDGPLAGFLDSPALGAFEQSALAAFVQAQRWFGGKSRKVESVRVQDWGPLGSGRSVAFLTLLEITFADGTSDRYLLPLAVSGGEAGAAEDPDRWVITRLKGAQGEAVVHDALAGDDFCATLLESIGGGREFRTKRGRIHGVATSAFRDLRGDAGRPLPVKRAPATSSNSLVFFGERLLLKVFRRLEVGTNPDYEIGRFLTEGGRFDRVPAVAGALEYHAEDGGGPITLGILQAAVPNQGDGWSHALEELSGYFARAATRRDGGEPVSSDPRPLAELAGAAPPSVLADAIGSYLDAAATLGRRTAEMHLALASDRNDPAFAPEPLTAPDLDVLREEILRQGQTSLAALGENVDRLPASLRDEAGRLLAEGPEAIAALAASRSAVPKATKTRVHGDYHLGQVLRVENDYVLIDFEGEPTRSVAERREKFSPVRDVAGMLRSYHYAAYAGLFEFAGDRPEEFARLVPWADVWQQWNSAAFLRGYLGTAEGADFLPRDRGEFADLLGGFMLAKALYELAYELNNRPDWVRIPLGGVLSLLEKT